MFSVVLRKSDRVRRYAVSALDDTGWQVTRENDGEPPRQIFYHDWHRLERALAIVELEVSRLVNDGWSEVHRHGGAASGATLALSSR